MTAVGAFQNQKPLSAPSQDARSREPSMEDILASIRRIIADDQLQAGRSAFGSLRRGTQPAIPGPAETAYGVQNAYEDVIDLAKMPDVAVQNSDGTLPQAMGETPYPEVEETHHAEDHTAHEALPSIQPPGLEVSLYDQPVAVDPEPRMTAMRHYPIDVPPAAPLEAQDEATDHGALISPELGDSVMSAFESLAATVVLQNETMLDRVMHDLMRPMIKTWLDENLPTIVERLVRGEIERVARGGKG